MTPDQLRRRVADLWPRAQEHWSRFLLLKSPVDEPKQSSVAQIDLASRQVGLHFRKILDKGLGDCLEGMLAHEVGHHVRYPGTLAVHARLQLLERTLLPLPGYSVMNLFTDLLINETLGRGPLREQLVRIYQAFSADLDWQSDPAFLFYLAVYEELWQLEPGSLAGPEHLFYAVEMTDYRADAALLAQNLFHFGPNIFTQFLYFVSVVSRYVTRRDGNDPVSIDPYNCGCGEPSADDWADALTPNAREREAIERAIREGWLRPEQGRLFKDEAALDRRIASLPGQGTADASRVPEVMAAWYRQQAERYLLRPPPQRLMGEAVVPTTHDDWEPGDATRDIDWLATLTQRGPLIGAASPLKRVPVAEVEGYDVPLWQPRIEVYVDVSGSMPDPRQTRNAMTLAAQVLVTAAIRAGGWARALLYSTSPVAYWEWCRSEAELSKFLMHYIGGGTEFPFDRLSASVRECRGRQPVRVVITDTDFDANYESKPKNAGVVVDAASLSPHFILLLHRPDAAKTGRYKAAGATVLAVPEMDDFPRMAADLSRALFGETNRVAR